MPERSRGKPRAFRGRSGEFPGGHFGGIFDGALRAPNSVATGPCRMRIGGYLVPPSKGRHSECAAQ
ncbi:hypothetical protein GCM10009863_46890 [Streptomyces axinellae]|uniref:Uncharacterized protein n=1 Tax=Streptomyces axinellae TaxID=552788 RepID=A0ABP6CV53_9ACTN